MTDRIRIAIVGFGLVGRQHAEVITSLSKLSLAAIVETAELPEMPDALQASDVPIYTDLEEMIAAEAPDGIIVATPTPLHLAHGLVCVAAKIPTLIEKPITVASNDAQSLVQAAHSADVPILVGHHRRHSAVVQTAKLALIEGVIGEIRAVQATCWLYKPDSYFAAAPWRNRKGAGPISINLVHDVDLLRYFCGEVESVRAVATPSRRGSENEDLATALLQFTSGAVATVSVSDGIAAPWSWELTARENPVYPATGQSCYLIGGSEGSLSLPDLRVWQHEKQPDWWSPMSARPLHHTMQNPLVTQMRHFVRVISGQDEPLVSGTEGARSLEVVEAIACSAATGKESLLEHVTAS